MSEKTVQLNEEIIKGDLKELVCSSVEETLNNLLEQEAKALTNAAKCERTEVREGMQLIIGDKCHGCWKRLVRSFRR